MRREQSEGSSQERPFAVAGEPRRSCGTRAASSSWGAVRRLPKKGIAMAVDSLLAGLLRAATERQPRVKCKYWRERGRLVFLQEI